MIAIIDYGVGNIKAFSNIYKNLNIVFTIAKCVEDLEDATKIILPGVGSFDYAMERLQKSGMQEPLNELVLKRKLPVLGVCVGMQMLANKSDEGKLSGLGWIDGVVKKFDQSKVDEKVPLPHMGWNNVKPIANNNLFQDSDIESRFYFLHSYYFAPHNEDNVLAVTDYNGPYASAVRSENVFGVQFHPEKSHQNGIQLLKNFANL